MEELYTMIGKLYVDLYNMQKFIERLQQQLAEKDNELKNLRTSRESDDRSSS